MTRLLVSVRSLDEARLAAAAGVDLIDLKEPRLGSLGRVEPAVAREVAACLATDRRMSMALGELAEWTSDDFDACQAIPRGIVFAKVGLAGCAVTGNWRSRWRRAIESLPPHCQPVAVAYADWRHADAPDPQTVLSLAAVNGCRALLIDTCNKQSGDVFACLTPGELRCLFHGASRRGLLTVLAGSLNSQNIRAALELEPDYVAVRGAVCGGTREAGLCAEKLREWRTAVTK